MKNYWNIVGNNKVSAHFTIPINSKKWWQFWKKDERKVALKSLSSLSKTNYLISENKCPKCGSVEVDALTPYTVYECGSRDYDQREGTFNQSEKCKCLEK